MKDEEVVIYFEQIKDIPTGKLAAIAGVSLNMAGKYKNGKNVPQLKGAISIEEKYNIPPKIWILLQEKASLCTA